MQINLYLRVNNINLINSTFSNYNYKILILSIEYIV